MIDNKTNKNTVAGQYSIVPLSNRFTPLAQCKDKVFQTQETPVCSQPCQVKRTVKGNKKVASTKALHQKPSQGIRGDGPLESSVCKYAMALNTVAKKNEAIRKAKGAAFNAIIFQQNKQAFGFLPLIHLPNKIEDTSVESDMSVMDAHKYNR